MLLLIDPTGMDLSINNGEQLSKALRLTGQSRRRQTGLALRRRHNGLMRELAREYGIDNPTVGERGLLAQAATILCRIESAAAKADVDSDTLIRLSGETRRLLAGLRRRKARHVPLRERLAAEAA